VTGKKNASLRQKKERKKKKQKKKKRNKKKRIQLIASLQTNH
jgi:hypothetical protein